MRFFHFSYVLRGRIVNYIAQQLAYVLKTKYPSINGGGFKFHKVTRARPILLRRA